ncbi:Ltp family lipoprotein [Pseudactinotalea sp. HY158]|uniref:Ltp family lipoprotein n=1 Tax=unclassified Pseudactinotalea TaxID=2649176 RepID=UPI001E29387E|nr:Ltp family lipoprotein [Pseudactinotalea sp. HY158]
MDDGAPEYQQHAPGYGATESTDRQPTARPWYKKKRFILPLGGVALLVAIAIVGGGRDDPGTAVPSAQVEGEGRAPSATAGQTETEAADEEESARAAEEEASRAAEEEASRAAEEESSRAAEEEASKAAAKAEEEAAAQAALTAGQSNALRAAESYLSFMPFSRNGLIEQLSSEYGDGYSVEDATFAADNVEVDWNEQAAKAAANYLDLMAFSRKGLIEQLTSEYGDGYTLDQATYGVDQAGL